MGAMGEQGVGVVRMVSATAEEAQDSKRTTEGRYR